MHEGRRAIPRMAGSMPRRVSARPPRRLLRKGQRSPEPGTGAGQDGTTPRESPAAPSAIADPHHEKPVEAGGSEQPAAAALRDRYLDVLLQRIASGADCPDRAYEYIEAQLTG